MTYPYAIVEPDTATSVVVVGRSRTLRAAAVKVGQYGPDAFPIRLAAPVEKGARLDVRTAHELRAWRS